MKKVNLICLICSKPFERPTKEYGRSQKLGRISYCSLSCAAVGNKNGKGDASRFGNSRYIKTEDELSPFRYTLRKAKQKAKDKGHEINISIQDLATQWNKQSGKCPYTGWKLKLVSKNDFHERSPKMASLDRIDSKLGYVVGNIQFVSFIANLAKNNFDEKDLLNFCRAVSNNRPTI